MTFDRITVDPDQMGGVPALKLCSHRLRRDQPARGRHPVHVTGRRDTGKLTGAVRQRRARVGARGARDSEEFRYRTSTRHWMPGAAASLASVVSSDVADSISVRATYVAS